MSGEGPAGFWVIFVSAAPLRSAEGIGFKCLMLTKTRPHYNPVSIRCLFEFVFFSSRTAVVWWRGCFCVGCGSESVCDFLDQHFCFSHSCERMTRACFWLVVKLMLKACIYHRAWVRVGARVYVCLFDRVGAAASHSCFVLLFQEKLNMWVYW